MQLIKLVIFILFGFGIARATGIEGLDTTDWYMSLVTALLAIGLYASTFGIDLKEARQHLRIILSAVTVGVVLKAAIIGGSLVFLFQDPFFLILGVVVAQIDPLSVASLMKGNRLSKKAKTILASWASFDDPVTVILSLYIPASVILLTGVNVGSMAGNTESAYLLMYVGKLGVNLAFAGGIFTLWLLIRRFTDKKYAWFGMGLAGAVYILLVMSFMMAIAYFLMLGIALIGLFLRPAKTEKYIDRTVTSALCLAAVLLGFLLVDGINLWAGIALGIAAYSAQIVVGWLFTRGLPAKDRWHISFAQQNGITAIILALLFEPAHPGTVAIVAPAIIVVNVLHAVVNKGLDNYVLEREVFR